MRSKNLVCKVEGCTASKFGKHARCRGHVKEHKAKWWAEHKEQMREKALEWRSLNEGRIYQDADGYVMYVGYDHPICNPSGTTRYHRLVLWDKLAGSDMPCDECGRQLYWDKSTTGNPKDELHVDHINEVKDDNRPENLAPICIPCNSKRARRNKLARLVSA